MGVWGKAAKWLLYGELVLVEGAAEGPVGTFPFGY
jgi:hypothetical protein